MTVSVISPGTYCSVSSDSPPLRYVTIQAPTPSMFVVAQDMIDLAQVVMNVQARSLDGYGGGSYPLAAPIVLSGEGISFHDNAEAYIGTNGYLTIGNLATVQSSSGAAYGGVYPFFGASILLDAASILHSDYSTLSGVLYVGGSGSAASLDFLDGSQLNIGAGAYVSIIGTAQVTNYAPIQNCVGYPLAPTGHTCRSFIVSTGSLDFTGIASQMPEFIHMQVGGTPRSVVLPAAGTHNGQTVTISVERGSATAAVSVTIAGGGSGATLVNTATSVTSVTFSWSTSIGVGWVVMAHSTYNASIG